MTRLAWPVALVALTGCTAVVPESPRVPRTVAPPHDTILEFKDSEKVPVAAEPPSDPSRVDRMECSEHSIGRVDNVRIVCELNFVGDRVLPRLEALDRPRVNIVMTGTPTQRDFQTITRVPWLTDFTIAKGEGITSLEPLRGLMELHDLMIDEANITDLSPLEGHDKLTGIRLSDTTISDIRLLGRLKSLREVNVHGTPVSDIEPLTHLPKLEFLAISSSRVRDIRPIGRMTSLQRLMIARLGITDLQPLATLTDLRLLIAAHNPITDLSPLASTRMGSLDVNDTAVTDLGPLAQLSTLGQVTAVNTPIKDLTPLTTPPHLQWIDVRGCRSITSIAPLARASGLRTLDISGTGVTSLAPLLPLKLYRVTTSVSKVESARFKSKRPDVEIREEAPSAPPTAPPPPRPTPSPTPTWQL